MSDLPKSSRRLSKAGWLVPLVLLALPNCFLDSSGVDADKEPPESQPASEDLIWTDIQPPSTAAGGTLTFPGPAAPAGAFSGGAASEQLITEGDAWVEFEAGELGVTHVLGLRASCEKIADCPDTDGSLADISLSLSLNVTGEVNVVEVKNGIPEVVKGPLDPYGLKERFRIYVVDHKDGTADLRFTRLKGPCVPNLPCDETPLYEHSPGPKYPLRVDATFREADPSQKIVASLVDVKILRMK